MHVLLPVAAAIAVALTLLAVQSLRENARLEQLAEVLLLRRTLDAALADLGDRHTRAVRHAREALHEPPLNNAVPLLQWIGQHYEADMERSLTDANRAMGAARSVDLSRLRGQLGRVREEAHRVTPLFDALIEARFAGDPTVLDAAELDFERADRAVNMALRIADDMLRSLMGAESARLLEGGDAHPVRSLSGAVALALIALALARRPLARLTKLSIGTPIATRSASREEARLSERLTLLENERGDAIARVQERTRELERGQLLLRRAEHELALLRFYNENLVNSLRSAIVVTDASGIITAVSRVARAWLGLDDTWVGCAMERSPLYHALRTRQPALADEIARTMAARQALRFEAVSLSPNLLVDLTLSPFQDESGAARGLLWVADDVTDAVQTKHQLLLAERLAAVGRLSAQVAHEIRNPLSAIGLNAELLEEDFAAALDPVRGAEARLLLAAIGSEVERLTEVTEAYLHLARLPRPNIRAVDINEFINDLFVMLAEEMRSHGVQVRLDLSTPSPRARADPGQLRQALINVVRNSREAMPHGGELRVTSTTIEGSCVVAVSDTGAGIDDAVLPRVFEPFYSTKPNGTGLGLSLTHQIMAEHGGHIDIRRSATGGTCVEMILPDAEPGAAESAA